MEKPKTIQGVLDALWYAVVGLNNDGLLGTVKQLGIDMAVLKAQAPTLWTRADHDQECEEDRLLAKQQERVITRSRYQNRVSVREWVTILIALGAVVVAALALVLKKGT
jgi:hypothetical protein